MKNTKIKGGYDAYKHVANPMHVANFLQGSRTVKPKKGKGSYSRKSKHKDIDY